ncbi:hypothetical protein K504DRAFT_486832 [Pleomassaria siparia CBS 279.74]|uniref:Uncharacterized protein n=1 Tax=Pleomassaria siparia CBS 279.74 TaxID=1314801 RepID=A0A6G1KR31_9PLEO|nr:hypothetical protein K504DRAFT_486832 [Pleomassaria siparia CBS 279.74]
MKITYLVTGLLTALLSSAQPVLEKEQFSVDYASGGVTGELAPQLVTEPLTGRALVKRANVEFIVYTSRDCSGNGLVITATGNGGKGNFNTQRSVRINQLTKGWHLTLYSGRSLSGVLTRFFATEVGSERCFVGSWLSYGLFSS